MLQQLCVSLRCLCIKFVYFLADIIKIIHGDISNINGCIAIKYWMKEAWRISLHKNITFLSLLKRSKSVANVRERQRTRTQTGRGLLYWPFSLNIFHIKSLNPCFFYGRLSTGFRQWTFWPPPPLVSHYQLSEPLDCPTNWLTLTLERTRIDRLTMGTYVYIIL